MGLYIKDLNAWVQSRLDPCPKEENRTDAHQALNLARFV